MTGKKGPRLSILVFLCGALAYAGTGRSAPATTAPTTIEAARIAGKAGNTRVTFSLSAPVDYRLFQLDKPDRVVLDLDSGRFDQGIATHAGAGVVKDIRIGHYQGKARIVLDLSGPAHPKSFLLQAEGRSGYQLVVDLGTPGSSTPQVARSADNGPTADKLRPVVIAVDPGHGGIDSGAHGQDGTLEKNVTLAIGERLAKLIDAQPGMRAVLTRTGDYYVPLEKRFQIAREDKADLFVSIHANSCPDDCGARGASVWVLSAHGKQSEAGRWLANSENASDLIGGVSLDNKSHMLASVLLDLSQGASMHAADEVGGDVLAALGKVGPLYRDTVQGANFVVLRSPDVPSILVETAFINNRSDERRLDNAKDREQLAEAILTGVKQYFETTPPPDTLFAEQRNQRLHLTEAPAPQVAQTRTTGAPADPPASESQTARPAASMQLASAKKVARADADIQDMHRVTRGETLSGIAQQYGVSMRALRSVNPDKIQPDGMLQAGQILLIPNS
jgi:N-acetylmuramoyl-L-alanine amidase